MQLRLMIRSGNQLSIYSLADDKGPIVFSKTGPFTVQGKLTTARVSEITLPDDVAAAPLWRVAYRGPDDWIIHAQSGSHRLGCVVEKHPGDAEIKIVWVTPPSELYVVPMRDIYLAACLAPPCPRCFRLYSNISPVVGDSIAHWLNWPAYQQLPCP